MTISVGQSLPDANLLRMGEDGPEAVALSSKLKGRKVVVFGLPGAYTGVCTTAHVPSFIRNKAKFDAKGVDEIICISVNDPFVMKAWGESTGATAAGVIGPKATRPSGVSTSTSGSSQTMPREPGRTSWMSTPSRRASDCSAAASSSAPSAQAAASREM